MGEGDIGGVAGAVAVAERVGKSGSAGFACAQAVEVVVQGEGGVSGIHVGDQGCCRRRRD